MFADARALGDARAGFVVEDRRRVAREELGEEGVGEEGGEACADGNDGEVRCSRCRAEDCEWKALQSRRRAAGGHENAPFPFVESSLHFFGAGPDLWTVPSIKGPAESLCAFLAVCCRWSSACDSSEELGASRWVARIGEVDENERAGVARHGFSLERGLRRGQDGLKMTVSSEMQSFGRRRCMAMRRADH